MSVGFIFWFVMLLWLLLSLFWGWRADRAGGFVTFAPIGINGVVFVLLFLLGWHVFGWPISG